MGLGVVVLGYIGLLYFGAVIVPGVGLAGHLMVLVPGSLLELAHAPGYGILAVLIALGLQRRAWPLAMRFQSQPLGLLFSGSGPKCSKDRFKAGERAPTIW